LGKILTTGDHFGELGLLTRKPRKATVLCLEETYFIYLEKPDYKNVVQSIDQSKMLKKLNFFSENFLKGYTQDGILKLIYFFDKIKLNFNRLLYQEGSEIDGCFLVKKGGLIVLIYSFNYQQKNLFYSR
jgi:hypothetical protein